MGHATVLVVAGVKVRSLAVISTEVWTCAVDGTREHAHSTPCCFNSHDAPGHSSQSDEPRHTAGCWFSRSQSCQQF